MEPGHMTITPHTIEMQRSQHTHNTGLLNAEVTNYNLPPGTIH